MPQFDPSFFLSQIFWLAICFAALYFTMSKIYLPRIKAIFKERKENIERNSLATEELEKKIAQISEGSKASRDQSSAQYQLAMDQATKQAALNREQALRRLREKTENMSENSQKQIAEFIINSKNNSETAIKNLVSLLSKKIFSSHPGGSSISIENLNK